MGPPTTVKLHRCDEIINSAGNGVVTCYVDRQSIDLYNSPLWTLKCEELAKLKIRMPNGAAEVESAEVEPVAAVAAGIPKASGPVELTGPLAAGLLQVVLKSLR